MNIHRSFNDFGLDPCRRNGECLFVGPSSLKTTMDSVPLDSKMLRPRGEAHRSVVQRQQMIVLFLSRLCFQCGPHAIARFISSVVVDAMQRKVCRWARSHIIEKWSKLMPARADLDTPAAVVFPALIAAVSATLQHAGPSVEFWRLRLTMRLHLRSCLLALPASTTFRRLTFKAGASDHCFVTATASATPDNGSSGALSRWFDGGQSARDETAQVAGGVITWHENLTFYQLKPVVASGDV